MCGRQACTLAPDQISKACQYQGQNGNKQQPRWKNGNSGSYGPSCNIGPKTTTPILASSKQLGLDENDYGERVLCPMQWGLVPPWSKDDGKGFNTINCCLETIQEKVTFNQPLNKGRRCVVISDGFFEWQTKDGKKQPYFLYFKDDIKGEQDCIEEHATPNRHILTMAGLFEESKRSDGTDESDLRYTYTVITVSSSENLKWLHERMPAILETEEEVRQWLDSGHIPASKALSLLGPKDCLQWYPVSTEVNNVRNKSQDCVKKIDLTEKKINPKGLMDFWVKKSPRKREPSSIEDPLLQEDKKIKIEVPVKQENDSSRSKEVTVDHEVSTAVKLETKQD